MTTRQNKKRKGRQNVNNRERTVTTLAEDPNTAFLVHTSSEDLTAGNSIPSHYSGNNNTSPQNRSYSQMDLRNPSPSGYNNHTGSMHKPDFTSVQQQQGDKPYLSQHPSLPTGQTDLEVLEKLKETIKNGQHEFFRAIPQPSALASIYLGSTSSAYNTSVASQVPPHPEQLPGSQNGANYSQNGNTSTPSALGGRDYPRRIRNHSTSMDSWDDSGSRKSISSPTVPPSQPRYDNTSNSNNLKSYAPSGPSGGSKHNTMDFKSSGPARDAPSDLGPRNSFSRPPVQPAAASRPDQQGRPGGDSTYGPKSSVDPKSGNDGKDDIHQRDSWSQRHGQSSQDDRPSRPPLDLSDRSPIRTGSLEASRSADRGHFDRDRERERDRERDRDRSRERDNRRFDRYDRRADDRPRIIDNRRPPPDQRHWEPPRRSFEHGNPIDRRATEPDLVSAGGDHGVPLDDRQSRLVGERLPSARLPDIQSSRSEATDDRRIPLPSSAMSPNDTRQPPSGPGSTPEDRNGRPAGSALPSAVEDSVARNAVEDRATRPPGGPKEERKAVSLEERISRAGPPSLQDRLNQPPVSDVRLTNRPPPTGPSLEERLSHPSSVQDTGRGGRIPPIGPDDRNNRQGPDRMARHAEGNRSTVSEPMRLGGAAPDERPSAPIRPLAEERGRLVERYEPPTEPVEDRKQQGHIPPSTAPSRATPQLPPSRPSVYSRAQSVIRDEVSIRDYRGGASGSPRAVSVPREPELRPYRPDPERFGGDRRTELVDVDRYSDNRSQTTYRRTPPLQQPVENRERGVWERPRWPSPKNDPYVEDNRFRANAMYHQDQWADYDSRARGWEEKGRQWEQNDAWTDRRFIERDAVTAIAGPTSSGNTGWETRQEREQREQREREQRRASYPPTPSGERPSVGYESRPLSSRLTDTYAPQPPEDNRGYASDLDATGLYAPQSAIAGPGTDANSPPFSRVRHRSPSPAVRDISRPPMKRPREDYSAANDYYSPHAPGAVAPPGISAGDYPPRIASPAPSTSGYYDRPPQSAGSTYSGTGAVGGAARDRDYSATRDGYQTAPATYDRRMPPPSRTSPQSSYQRGNYVRDDRRYPMPQSRPV